MLDIDSPGTASSLLKYALSVITSPAFFQIVVIHRDYDYHSVRERSERSDTDIPPLRRVSRARKAEEASCHNRRFELFRKLHKARGFDLMLCADVWDRVGGCAIRALKRAVAPETVRGGVSDAFSKPSVVYSLWRSCHALREEVYATGFAVAWTSL